MRSATALHWNFSGEHLGILHYARGDVDAYVAELDSIRSVLSVDVARTDERGFYAYHQRTVDGATADPWRTLTDGTLLPVPPVKFGSDGSVTFSPFGARAEIRAAIEAAPDPIDVEIREVSGMAAPADRPPSPAGCGRRRVPFRRGLSPRPDRRNGDVGGVARRATPVVGGPTGVRSRGRALQPIGPPPARPAPRPLVRLHASRSTISTSNVPRQR